MNLPADTPAPGVLVDGRKIELPATFERIQLFGSRKVHCLQFELDGRTVTIEGDFTLLIQDDRKWRNNHFVFRLGADPVSGTLKEASLDLRLRVASPRTVAVDLKPAFNMGFRDEKLNDGKGGWTDQGPSNDLSMMKPGKLAALGVEFDIADPARNDGRSCLVLSSGQKKFPAEKTVNCAKTAGELRYLYLLHASAWTPAAGQPVGTIAAEYADGGKKEFPVLAGRDVGNWWQPFSFPNGALAVAALNAGKIDVIVIDGEPAKIFADRHKNLLILPEPLTVEEYAIAIRKGNTELLEQVNRVIRQLKENGGMAAIRAKYIK